jgi:hypothetical protein
MRLAAFGRCRDEETLAVPRRGPSFRPAIAFKKPIFAHCARSSMREPLPRGGLARIRAGERDETTRGYHIPGHQRSHGTWHEQS